MKDPTTELDKLVRDLTEMPVSKSKTREILEEWLTTHTLPKKEVARVIEGMMETSNCTDVADYNFHKNQALTDLKRALNLEEPRAENNQQGI